ncbi:Hypothetical protein GbCGDNIH9_7112 [Granulibacter bethesdensis]|uniref:Uncharacterized protein n=1 Tax=Granulibacter bethesdensis TaxID=364410 RepID=A0AAC9KEU5_9PROT|nr:Hypothetical protein GbCGDNIH9_7112 [Granulibacter bethesdensis]APH62584.1 Hypothetical protein GbCGDNIH8_8027 [Granulibacter bethesdensis]
MKSTRVYLRARGGTGEADCRRLALYGLSPRTRRNPARQCCLPAEQGSISAHAEEP